MTSAERLAHREAHAWGRGSGESIEMRRAREERTLREGMDTERVAERGTRAEHRTMPCNSRVSRYATALVTGKSAGDAPGNGTGDGTGSDTGGTGDGMGNGTAR